MEKNVKMDCQHKLHFSINTNDYDLRILSWKESLPLCFATNQVHDTQRQRVCATVYLHLSEFQERISTMSECVFSSPIKKVRLSTFRNSAVEAKFKKLTKIKELTFQ